jgi:hypothetical protein
MKTITDQTQNNNNKFQIYTVTFIKTNKILYFVSTVNANACVWNVIYKEIIKTMKSRMLRREWKIYRK